uniref:hypothetical protein n=1 Tax=uncultured Erythrobacter sp. TaxID=263913 RepID=UPI0026089A6B|nr:hypothetical protein [uncultured Erythrobacter sp.]
MSAIDSSIMHQTLLPLSVASVNGIVLVHLIDPDRLDLSRGFLKLSVPKDRPIDKIQQIDEWLDQNPDHASTTDFAHTAGIFHVARCGSTLLTQNVKNTGGFIALSEPGFVGKLLNRFEHMLEPEIQRKYLRATIAAWQDWSAKQNKQLLIKFNSLTGQAVSTVFSELQNAQFVFLFREPVAVLESLTRKPPAYVKNGEKARIEGALPEFEAVDQSTQAYFAARAYCEALRSFEGLIDPRLLAIEYDDLQAKFADVLRHFKFIGDANSADWDAKKNAKWKGSRQDDYKPISIDELTRFAGEQAEYIQVARGYFERFRDQYEVSGGTL